MVKHIHGTYKIQYHPDQDNDPDKVYEIDFTPPFRRIPMMSELKKTILGMPGKKKLKWPANNTLHKDEARTFFDKLCKDLDVECSNPRTTARLIDKLVGEYLET